MKKFRGNVQFFLIFSISVGIFVDVDFVYSEEPSIRVPHRQRMQEIKVVGSKEAVSFHPGSAAFLDKKDINNQGYDDINRVLSQVPGVYLREEDGYGLFPNISLRGADPGRSGKVTVMEDGVLTAPAPYSAPGAYYTPTIGRMHAVEVLKGSSQILYGPHTTGGAINYLSTPVPDKRTLFIKALGGYDNGGELRFHSSFGDTIDSSAGRIGYLVEAYYRDVSGFKQIDETPDFSDSDRTGFKKAEPMIKIAWEPDSLRYQRFEAKFGFTDLDADETYLGLNSGDFELNPTRRYAASRFDNIKSEHYRSYLRHMLELTPQLSVTTTGYYQHFHRNWFKLHELRGSTQSLSEALADVGGGLSILKGEAAGTLRYRNNDRDYYLAGIESVASYGRELFGLKHQFNVGLRFHQDRIRRRQTNEDFTQLSTGVISARTSGGYGLAGNRKQLSQAYAVSLLDRIELGSLALTPGIRWEHVDYEFKDFNSSVSGRNDIDVFAPGIGAIFDFSDEWSAFGGVHKGFSVPGPKAIIVSAIKEEESIGMELGSRFNNANGVQAEAVFFLTDFDNLVVTDNIGAGGTGTTENIGDVNILGGEFLLGFNPGQYFNWGLSLPNSISLTVTRAKLDGPSNSTDPESLFAGGEDGNDVPYVPNFQFSVGSGIEDSRFGVFLNGTYVAKAFTTASNTTSNVNPSTGVADERFGETDDRFVLDLSASYLIRDGAKLLVNLHNITDAKYIVSRHPHGPRPGRPFSVTAGMELIF